MLAEFFADAREREPGGREIRRQLDRLHQQIGGGGQIALQLQIAREFEPAVGHQITGGEKKAGRHIVREPQLPNVGPAIHKKRFFRKTEAQVKPTQDG